MNTIDKIYQKLPRETAKEYIIRICSYKDSFGLKWEQIKAVCNNELGVNYSESYYRKNYKEGIFRGDSSTLNVVEDNPMIPTAYTEQVRRNSNLDSEDEDDEESEFDDDNEISEKENLQELLEELQRERIKIRDERTSNNAAVRRLVREETCVEIAREFAEQMSEKKILQTFPEHRVTQLVGNKAILVISDWHYGIDINSRFNVYNPDICAERVSTLLQETLNLCSANRVKEIYVVNLADLISGRIHTQIRIQNREDVITQIMKVSEMVAELLNELSCKYKVHYLDCLDNHSRVEPNKNESLDLESLCRITPWYLKFRFEKNKNVIFHDNEFGEDIITFECNGFNVAGVHGDHDKPNKVNANITLLTQQHYDLILTAHLHHFSADEHTNTLIVSNGSLMGQDDYAKKLRLNSAPSQNLIIVSEDNVMKALYRIVV